jgi:hypothetical protein
MQPSGGLPRARVGGLFDPVNVGAAGGPDRPRSIEQSAGLYPIHVTRDNGGRSRLGLVREWDRRRDSTDVRR